MQEIGVDLNAEVRTSRAAVDVTRYNVLMLPDEVLNRIVRLVNKKAERQMARAKHNEKQRAWNRAVRAHAQGLALLKATCKKMATGLQAVAEGMAVMVAAREWRRQHALWLDGSDSDSQWSPVGSDVTCG